MSARMFRRKPRKVFINRIEIPPEVLVNQRNEILEHDQLYATNQLTLIRRVQQGKVSPRQYGSITAWQMKAALRRAHVTLKLASAMLVL